MPAGLALLAAAMLPPTRLVSAWSVLTVVAACLATLAVTLVVLAI